MKHLTNPRIYLIAISTAFVLHSFHFNYFVCDDAFISFRYAKNLISGHGLVWNIGEQPPIEGYTNFLWVIIISLFMKMGFEPVTVSKALNIFFGLCCIFLTYSFSELILQRKSFLNLTAPVILACCGSFAAWSIEGLETLMFTLFILAAVITYLYETQNDKVLFFSAILFVLASLTRPEGLLIFAVTCLHRFAQFHLLKKNPFCRKTVIWFLTFLILYGSYFYWRFNYYGFLFPNTFYAKTGGGIYQFWRGFRYFVYFTLYNKWPILIALGLPLLFKPLRSAIAYLLMLSISFSGYIMLIGGDFFAMFRFFMPIVPLLAILVQEEVISFIQWCIKLRHPKFIKLSVITLCSSIFILILAMSLKSSFKGHELFMYFKHQRIANTLASEGKWLHQHAFPDETIASVGIGAISYYSELTTIDRLGITDIHVAHTTMPHMGKGVPGHEKRNFSYILSKKPTYFFGKLIDPKKSTYFKPSDSEIRKFNQLYKSFQIREPNLKVSLYKLK